MLLMLSAPNKLNFCLLILFIIGFMSCMNPSDKQSVTSQVSIALKDTSYWHKTKYCFIDGHCTQFLKTDSELSEEILTGDNKLNVNKTVKHTKLITPITELDSIHVKQQLDFILNLISLRPNHDEVGSISVENFFTNNGAEIVEYSGNLTFKHTEFKASSSLLFPESKKFHFTNLKCDKLLDSYVVHNEDGFEWKFQIDSKQDDRYFFLCDFLNR